MPNAGNAILYYEADQLEVAMTELTDQGDQTDFRSAVELWSGRAGKVPDVKPNGVKSGGAITPEASGTNDQVDLAEVKVYLAGVETTVSAVADQAIVRPAVSNFQKQSITVTSGGAYAVVEGTEGSAFSDTRGAAGGPPYIDNDAIETGQVWYNSQTPAVVAASEIKQVENVSLERYDLPNWEVEYVEVTNGIIGYAGIEFHSALPLIHSEDAGTNKYGKDVYASYYTPVFIEVVDAYDFNPPANAHSINTQQVYGRTKGSKSTTLNAGGFSFEMKDGITDNVLKFADQLIWFKFKPERLNDPYILAQGYLGVVSQFPAGANINATCSIAAETLGERVNA